MIRISAPHFVAGTILLGGVIVQAAPIVKYMVGWDYDRVLAYCRKRRWKTELIIVQR